jgi:hypothetical protein
MGIELENDRFQRRRGRNETLNKYWRVTSHVPLERALQGAELLLDDRIGNRHWRKVKTRRIGLSEFD